MPVVLALMGLPGSGKTTVAERLARARDLAVVSRDAIRAAMFRPCGYTEVEKETAYSALLLGVAACLELGRSCVVEGMPFSCAHEVDDVRKLADAGGSGLPPGLPRLPDRCRAGARRTRSCRAKPRVCGSRPRDGRAGGGALRSAAARCAAARRDSDAR